MDEFSLQQVNVEPMTTRESYLAEIKIFQKFVSEAKITRESLINGWENYHHFAFVRWGMNLDKPPKERAEAPEILFKAADRRLRLLLGKEIALKKVEKTSFRQLFIGDTFGTILAGGQLGILFEGLAGKKLKNAKMFCRAMNKIGLKPGDIDKVNQAS